MHLITRKPTWKKASTVAWARGCTLQKNCCRSFRQRPVFFWYRAAGVTLRLLRGTEGTYSESSGATEDSSLWGVGKPLYQDLVSRTEAALAKNPKNVLLAVCWMQGEIDMKNSSYDQHPDLFSAMVSQFRTDLTGYAGQCTGGSSATVPWICGDTTYYWKDTYSTQYETVYGGYENRESENIFFVPFMTDENGVNTPTNEPSEDPDIASAGYYGAASRTSDN